MNEKKTPRIRFKGFTDDWKQRKLGELAEIKDSARIPNAEWSESGVPYIRASDITNEDASGALFISHERYEFYKNKTGAPAKGDVLFNGGGEIGKTMLNSSDSPIYVQGGAVLYARTSVSDSLDGQYLKTYFETPNAQHYFETASAGGTMKHFTLKPSQEMPIKIPKMEEQKRIGECFSELDSLITLHQRKREKLQIIKKSMLENCFPKNGERVPRIRFAGFTGDWEQRKVGELLSERIEQFPKSDEYPLMAFVANEGVAPKGDRYDRSALVNDTEGKLYKRTEFGDFIYSSNNLETGSIGLNKYGNATISPVYSIFRPTGIADSDFIGRRFVRKDFINEMVKWRQGVIYGQWKIHEEDFLKIEVMVPSLEEQRRIGSFLDNLDHLITLHQRKCDAYKKFKKAMMQKMFV